MTNQNNNQTLSINQFYSLLFLSFLLIFILTPVKGYEFDTNCWSGWAAELLDKGIANSYSVKNLNYNPLFLYVLWVYAKLMGSILRINENIYHLKQFVLLFDYLAIVFLAKFLLKRNTNYFYGFYILFNVAYLYNTIFWGQLDAIHTTLMLLSFFCLFEKKAIPGVIFFVLALNMKLQAIVFTPLFILLLLPALNYKTLGKTIITAIIVQVIIVLPYILHGTVMGVWNNNVNSVGFAPLVSLNAFNVWHILLFTQRPMLISDEVLFIGISYKHWGFIMFFLSSFIVLMPLILVIVEKREQDNKFYQLFFLTCALITFTFFYFNTEMHERYIHPAILFLGIYAILASDYIIYIFLSVIYFLSLEKFIQVLRLNSYTTSLSDPLTFIFERKVIAVLYLAFFIMGLYKLLKIYSIKRDEYIKLFYPITYFEYFKNNYPEKIA